MAVITQSVGSSSLLRLAGSPARVWLASANPDLFAALRLLNRTQERYAELGLGLAERIGERLVPHPRLERHERRLTLDLRRRLHRGAPIDPEAGRRLAARVRDLGDGVADLLEPLSEAILLSKRIPELERRVEAAVEAEADRLVRLPWTLVRTSPLIRTMLRHRSPEVYAVLRRRIRRGTAEAAKQAEYVWEMIDRAATKSTPRDWHGQVALFVPPPGEAPSPPSREGLRVPTEFALHWMENLHQQRRLVAAGALDEAADALRIALTPLHARSNGHLECWVVDPERMDQLTEVRLKVSDYLASVCAPLGSAAPTLRELEAAVVPDGDADERRLLRLFLERLVGMGVVEVSGPVPARLEPWRPGPAPAGSASPTRSPDGSPGKGPHRGFLDVYRRVDGEPAVPGGTLQRDVVEVLRVLTAITADQYSRPAGGDPGSLLAVDEEPRPLLDLLRRRLEEGDAEPHPHRAPRHWPSPVEEGSAYAALLGWIERQADAGEPIRLSGEVLDGIGAPAASIDWPIDCVLRLAAPGAGFHGVFDEVFPAGALDARLLPALLRLHGRVPHAEAYRRFLRRLEEASGARFVELLIPPLSLGAANAVRRPTYTRAWTGDADGELYLGAAPGSLDEEAPRYIPLGAITLRRAHGRLVAEADGAPICPMYHATRLPLGPWRMLANTLLGATPLPIPWVPRRLDISLDAFPDRRSMPRITVGEGLVLSPAQWRIDAGESADERVGTVARLRWLERLRRETDLPRWVFVHDRATRRAVACDLESLRALRTLSRAARSGSGEVILTEMLPPPDRFPTRDEAHGPDDRLASSLMLRLPVDESPEELAERIAPRFARLQKA